MSPRVGLVRGSRRSGALRLVTVSVGTEVERRSSETDRAVAARATLVGAVRLGLRLTGP